MTEAEMHECLLKLKELLRNGMYEEAESALDYLTAFTETASIDVRDLLDRLEKHSSGRSED